MLNCPTCEFADFDSGKCKRLLIRLPHICPYSEDRKPRNHFEEIKNMSMEEMAEWLSENDSYFPTGDHKARWLKWLMEGVDHES